MSRKAGRYRKIATECYQRVLDRSRGQHFEVEDVRDELLGEIVAQGVGDDIVDDFVDGLVKAEDDRRADTADSAQLDLLTGDDEALDAIWRLGGGERVQVRYAVKADCYRRLGLRAENVAAVNAAFAKEQARIAKLMPYMTDDSVTVEQARERHRAAPSN